MRCQKQGFHAVLVFGIASHVSNMASADNYDSVHYCSVRALQELRVQREQKSTTEYSEIEASRLQQVA